ncbi:MAG: hypothetical protein QNL70_05065, partial [Pseudomonas sp.]
NTAVQDGGHHRCTKQADPTELLQRGWPEDCAMNINFPAMTSKQVKGVAICQPRRGSIGGVNIEARRDTRDIPYYWMGFQRQTDRVDAPESDVRALREGLISMSPLRLERDIAAGWEINTDDMAREMGIKG